VDILSLYRKVAASEAPKGPEAIATVASLSVMTVEVPEGIPIVEAVPPLEAIIGEALVEAAEERIGKRLDPPPTFPGDPPGPTWDREVNYRIWERAAIYEHDGGLSRGESEKRAIEEVIV